MRAVFSSRRELPLDAASWPELVDESRALLFSAGDVVCPDADETLWEAGSDYDLYLVLNGAINLIDRRDNRVAFVVEVGEFVGELGMLMGQPAFLAGTAADGSILLRVRIEALKGLMGSSSALSDTLMSAFEARRLLLVRQGEGGLVLAGLRHSFIVLCSVGHQEDDAVQCIGAELHQRCNPQQGQSGHWREGIRMSSVVATMSITLDGVGAGQHVTEEQPFGDLPEETFFRWMRDTPEENNAAFDAIVAGGAYVMGRNMFGPIKGEWTGDWRGWWGPNPPYHAPVFVLTHHPREQVVMEGGTTFYFVTDGIEAAIERAKDAADDRPVHVAGGPTTTNAALAAGLVDELYLNINPVVAGHGLRLFDGVGPLRLEQVSMQPSTLVSHARYRVIHDTPRQ